MSNGDNDNIVDDVVDAVAAAAHCVVVVAAFGIFVAVVGLASTGSGPAATVSMVCAAVQHFIIS